LEPNDQNPHFNLGEVIYSQPGHPRWVICKVNHHEREYYVRHICRHPYLPVYLDNQRLCINCGKPAPDKIFDVYRVLFLKEAFVVGSKNRGTK
jgi:hypothetical protein